MITRVWGIVNREHVEFNPVADKPDYWEGIATKVKGLQEIEIWAENDKGVRGHLECGVNIRYHTNTEVRLLLSPYLVKPIPLY